MSENFLPEANPNAPSSVTLTDLVDTYNTATGVKFPTRWQYIKSLIKAGVSSVTGTPDKITVAPTTGDVVVTIADTYAGQTSIITTGTVTTGTWNANILMSDKVAPSAPASGNLILQSFNQQGFSVAHVYDPQGNATEITRDNIFVARNTTGSSIAKGKVIYCSGSTGTVPNVTLAKADSVTTIGLIGVMYETTANNSFGRVMMLGNLENFDLSSFSNGDLLYVSATTAGGLTKTAPTYPNIAQTVGVVLNNGVGNGVLQVYTRGAQGVSVITDGQALTKVDDTNVTLTLGGTPTTALIRTASLTLGWTGTLSPTRGGTGVANNAASTLTISGAFATTLTVTNTTTVTLPTSGTLYGTLANSITSAQLASSLSDETGSGLAVFATNPTLGGVTFTDATNIVFNATIGTKIGTATTQKLAFYNSTPIVQPTGDVITALQNLGLGASLTINAAALTGIVPPQNGGTGVANNSASTLTISGNFGTTLTVSAATSLTLPTSGTVFSDKASSITSAQLSGALTDETGTLKAVFSDSPVFTTTLTTPQITGGGSGNTGLILANTVTASAGVVYGTYTAPTLTAAANSDKLYGLYIAPTFTLGAFTSTNSFAIGALCGTGTIYLGNQTGSTSITSLYLFPAGTTPSSTNYALSTNASANTIVNGATTAALASAGTIRLSVTSTTLAITDAINIQVGTTTGTKIGTATSQKLSFWNATPIVQPTTGIAASTFVANTSGIANDTATWDSYTIGQVVKALRNTGILA